MAKKMLKKVLWQIYFDGISHDFCNFALMYQHLRCVVLRTVKYDDRHSIVTVWSAERGRVGLLVPGGASREAVRRRAIMMPMGIFEGEADVRPGRDLFNIRDVRPMAVLPSVASSPSKAVVAMFLAEVLERVLRDSAPDEVLSEYIFQSVVLLDKLEARGVANFPVVFLCRLSSFLGIEPDLGAWRPGMLFDMTEGVYRRSAPLAGRWLDERQSAVAAMIQRLDFASASRLRIARSVRREILNTILEYYTLHLVPLDNLKTLGVISDIL